MMTDLDLIAILRAERRRQGLTQLDLAIKTGHHDNSISSWEAGLRRPKMDSLTVWCAALGLQLDVAPSGLSQRGAIDAMQATIDEQRAEIERLRAAIVKCWGTLDGVK